jgi:hypothetical protein
MGAPTWPQLSHLLTDMGGPDMAPHTPQPSERSGEALALLENTREGQSRRSNR